MRVGLFFGSFNPVHVGHMIIANYLAQHSNLNQVWMVITPHNPLKKRKSLANDYDRLHLVNLAIGDNDLIQASNIEFSLPKPSYTIDTLTYLSEKYKSHEFVLIMGGDNLETLHKWKNYEKILEDYSIYVYKRPGYELGELVDHPSVEIFEAPQMHISSNFIRKELSNGQSIQYLVTEEVRKYILQTGMYLMK